MDYLGRLSASEMVRRFPSCKILLFLVGEGLPRVEIISDGTSIGLCVWSSSWAKDQEDRGSLEIQLSQI